MKKMDKVSKLSRSDDYVQFRCSVPLRNICVENSKGESWKVFDAGPKSIKCPMIFLPPACGTADLFFKQLLHLSRCGYRVLSVESPNTYWTVTDWCIGFSLLLDNLRFDKIHLFGASLGGFLAQKFAENTFRHPRVLSLFLCNTFADTEIFDYTESASLLVISSAYLYMYLIINLVIRLLKPDEESQSRTLLRGIVTSVLLCFWMIPQIFLKRLIYPSLVTASSDPDIIDAVEFVAEKSQSLRRLDLASRLTINCISSHVNSAKLCGVQMVTIMDVFDEYALYGRVREEIYDYYPRAKIAQLKCGGNYPYLSKYEEVNMHLKIHLRKFEGTRYSALVERKENIAVAISEKEEEIQDSGNDFTLEEETESEKEMDTLVP